MNKVFTIEEIFNTFYDKIYSFTLMRVGNVHDSEDITSDVFMKVAEKIDTYNPDKAAFSTWIFVIALNEIRMFYRKRKPIYSIDCISEFVSSFDIEENLLKHEERIFLYKAIENLDEISKEVVLLRYFADLSTKQIAEITALSETNVDVKMHRAKEKIKKYLINCKKSGFAAYKGI
ncbi:MAG: sigma-70 family RNA polymerase sigma factor [Oscillospiraceae bacterium]|jgi:RNA polymerase sigma-70 factor (ECF subfamily)|nr:sigma-70 family RNA polymerase sigma factor [Oscillospiraceae bacterium]